MVKMHSSSLRAEVHLVCDEVLVDRPDGDGLALGVQIGDHILHDGEEKKRDGISSRDEIFRACTEGMPADQFVHSSPPGSLVSIYLPSILRSLFFAAF